MKQVLGYFADWTGMRPDQLDPTLYTQIVHAFAAPLSNGSLRLPDASRTRALVRSLGASGGTVFLAVGGEDSGTAFRSADPERLASALASAADDLGYGGIDIDWEFCESEDDARRLRILLRSLRERLSRERKISMAIPSGDWYGRWLPVSDIVPLVDQFQLMSYDYSGPWSQESGHNAALPDVNASLTYWTVRRKLPIAKVLLGIPLYGRGFRTARFGEKTTGAYERSEVRFRDLPALQKAGWKRHLDKTAAVPYLMSPTGQEILSYDDPASTRTKGALAGTSGLGGIFFWEVSQDGPNNPLVRAARKGLGL
jgi:chitinase